MRTITKRYLDVDNKPVWSVILKGAAIPGIIILVFTTFTGVIAFFSGDSDVMSAIKFGIFMSMSFCFFGGLYVILELILLPISKKSKAYLILGYILVICVSVGAFTI